MAHDQPSKKPLIDPKELFPAVIGLGLGVLLMMGFLALALAMGLTLTVDHGAIPHQ